MAIQHRNRSRNIGFGEPLATGTRRSLGKHTLALPCVALALAVVLCIFNTLQGLPQSSSGFVGVSSNVMSLSSERVRSNVARKNSMDDQVAYMKERQSRRLSRTPRNRGSDEYKALGAESRAEKEAEWNVFNSRGTENVVGSDGWMPKVTAPPTEEKSSGPAIELPSFSLPEVSLPSFPAPHQHQHHLVLLNLEEVMREAILFLSWLSCSRAQQLQQPQPLRPVHLNRSSVDLVCAECVLEGSAV